jgi:hypothetical protein
VCVTSAVTLVVLGTRLTFFNDDWYFLLQRPGLTAHSVLTPHNGHLSALPVLIYKTSVELFGLGHQLPFRVVLAGAVASVGVLVYLLVSERVGPLLGFLAATIVVFLGPAWEDLLWSFQIGLVGSLATGLAALLALERDGSRRNALGCAALVCSILFSDVGLPFVVAAAIAIALRRRWDQVWIVIVPAAVFGAWWVAYGSDAPSTLSAANIRHLPRYTIDAIASGLASLGGVNSGAVTATTIRGLVLLVAAAAAVVAWVLRAGRPSSRLLVFVGAALAFWGLAGANYIPGREPYASRYQLIDAVLLLLIAAELFRQVHLRRWQAGAVVALAALVLASNVVKLGHGFTFMRERAAYARVDLGALEITRGRSAPGFQLFPAIAHDQSLTGVTAGRYFAETDAHGSPPVSSSAEIAAASDDQRQAADNVLAAAYRMLPIPARPNVENRCRRVGEVARPAGVDVVMPAGGATITVLGRGPIELGVRRFASPDRAVSVGRLLPGATARIGIPRDGLARRWHVTARGPSALRICPL